MLVLVLKSKDGQPVRHRFDKDVIRIGRSADNDLTLTDVSVSRHHCEIRKENNLHFIYDLQSLNGTCVNGQKVKRASLQNNDLLRIGNVEVLVFSQIKRRSGEQSDHFLINKLKGVKILQALNIQSFQNITPPAADGLDEGRETIADGLTTSAQPADPLSYMQEVHRLRRAYRHLLFSYGLTTAISSIESREEFLRRLVKSLFIAFDNVERAFVTGFVPSTETFPVLAGECSPGFEAVGSPLCHTALLLALTDRKALCAENTLESPPGLPEGRVGATKDGVALRSIMCVPLVCQNEALGVIYVENFTKPDCFDDVDLELLCVISVLSATTLKNIELYDRLSRAYDEAYQKFHEQLSLSTTLCELGRALTASLAEEDILRRIVPMLREQIGVIWAGAGLFRPVHKRHNCVFYFCDVTDGAKAALHIEKRSTSLQRSYLLNFVKDVRIVSISDLRRETSPFVPIIRTFPEQVRWCVFAPLVVKKETIGFLVLALADVSHIGDNLLAFINGVAYQSALAFETARLFEAQKEQQAHLREMSNQIIAAQELERKRLARELHDDIGQIFSAIRLHVEALAAQKPAPPVGKTVETLKDLATHGMEELRHISLNLRPPMLNDLGLLPTLNWFAKDYTARYGITVKIQPDVDLEQFKAEFETNLFRIIQEALNNVAKHAGASNVLILLREQAGRLEVRIADDGKGFPVAELDDTAQTARRGFGLLNMKERAGTFNGTFEVISQPATKDKSAGGTTLRFIFPLDTVRPPAPTPAG
ncbi:MAG: hypothetical protein Kow0059_11100 [Candidatus Sumerlaeia bacterium]